MSGANGSRKPRAHHSPPPDLEFWRQVGAAIEAKRRAHRVNQCDLAAAVGYSKGGLSALEGGRARVPLETLCVIAGRLGETLESLLVNIKLPTAPPLPPSVRKRLIRKTPNELSQRLAKLEAELASVRNALVAKAQEESR